ncbi:MAG: VC0807 family protein [Acidimicrobiales bacterium]
MPSPRAALRHALPIVLEGIVGPLVLFYGVLVVAGFRTALIAALCWSYGASIRRIRRGERITALLMLGTLLLTLRTTVAFVTGSAFVYFIQPTAGTFLVAVVLLISAVLRRPFTQRFAHDFCPLDPELLARPRVQKFFVQISVVWAVVLMLNAGLVLWLLASSSLKMFVVERTAATWTLTSIAIAISIAGFTAAMRSDDVTIHWGSHRAGHGATVPATTTLATAPLTTDVLPVAVLPDTIRPLDVRPRAPRPVPSMVG